jgi:serine/threonine protein phosphatase 1
MSSDALPISDKERFSCLQDAARIWVIGSIHGNLTGLKAIHRGIFSHIKRDDKFIYLGNYYGDSDQIIETIDDLLLTRREIMSMPSVYMPEDFIYLRGAKEEMFSKLLQIQFSPNPAEVMDWLLEHGMGKVLSAYGSSAEEARSVSHQGTMAMTKWTGAIRRVIYSHLGHSNLASHLRRAAFTGDGKLLFVHASVDVKRPLTMQKDNFWWDHGTFDMIEQPYSGFSKIIRGYDHQKRGSDFNSLHRITLDGGSGRGGKLEAICISAEGEVIHHLSE